MSSRVTLNDIEGKLRQLGSTAKPTVDSPPGPPVIAGGAVGAVVLVAVIYLLGRHRGRKSAPVLEIRRI